MTNNDKELDKEAERAFEKLTTARQEQDGFDQEFDVAFDGTFDREISEHNKDTAKTNQSNITKGINNATSVG